jgi:hypothetical protein
MSDKLQSEDFLSRMAEEAECAKQQKLRVVPLKVRGGGKQLDEWDFGEARINPAEIEPRGWLLGNLMCRQFLSSLIGDGGVGKTAFRILCALALATGRKDLLGIHVFGRCRVLYLCFEDGEEELKRRICAAMIYYDIRPEDIEGYLFVKAITDSRWKMATTNEARKPQPGPLFKMIKDAVARRSLDVVILDPWVKTHSLDENNNTDIDFVSGLTASLAIECDVAIDTPEHVRKGSADPGNADAGRGASAKKDAGRLVYSLCTMTGDEAKTFGVPEKDRKRFIRLDSAKVNITPPAAEAQWFELISVPIGNTSNPLYPSGDSIQVVKCWKPPELMSGITIPIANAILDDIDKGLPNGQRYSDAPRATTLAAWPVVQKHCPHKNEQQCRKIVSEWVKNELLVKGEYHDPAEREKRISLARNPAKSPG